MTRPSEPILRWLREQLKAKGLNTATIAAGLDMPRVKLRKKLTGADDLTVDELLSLTESMKLEAEEFGWPAPTGEFPLDQEEDLGEFINQPRALLQMGFRHGIDTLLLLDTSQLGEWNGPEAVLMRYEGRELPIRLDALYHQYNNPRYDENGFTLTLSFDTLYDCVFPWSAVKQVIFTPVAPEHTPQPEEPEPEGPKPKAPFLRIVK